MSDYNGWKNRATWNVSMWISSNDEFTYNMARDFMRKYKGRSPYRAFVNTTGLCHVSTPDGYKFLSRQLSLSQLNAMMRELGE
jgi:hypothetical protein